MAEAPPQAGVVAAAPMSADVPGSLPTVRLTGDMARAVRVVVDTDTGIDDAMALVWLATRPGVEIVAAGSTHGNCRADQAALNALRVLEACGRGSVPVAVGLPGPVAGDATFATHVHGGDGLGDAVLAPPLGRPTDEGAVDQLIRLGHEHPGELDLLALGPLTNLAAALAADPAALAGYRSITVMGGAGVERADGPDPTLGVGDPNTAHDPTATARVAEAAPLQMVGVDVTLAIRFGSADLDRIAAARTPVATLLWTAMQFYIRFHEPRFGPRTCCAHDVIAAAALTDPEMVQEWAAGTIAVVDGPGDERAVLRPDADGASHAVVRADGPAILRAFIDGVTRL